jgi:hypothetical protein
LDQPDFISALQGKEITFIDSLLQSEVLRESPDLLEKSTLLTSHKVQG